MSRKNRRYLEERALLLGTAFALAISGTQSAVADDSSSSSSSSSSSDSGKTDSGSTSLITPLFPSTPAPNLGSDPTAGGSPTTVAPSSSGASESKWKEGDKDLTPVNPLKGLFQPQPQYPTPGTTQMFPEAVSPNMGKDSEVSGRHPGQAGTVYQSQWKDPYAAPEEKNTTSVNPLKGLFQPQPQYPSPGKTQQFPEAVPQHLGSDSDVAGRHPGQSAPTFQSEWKDPYAKEEPPSKDKNDYLKGLFQQQPQYASPGKTVMYPEAKQHNLGDDSSQPGRQPGSAPSVFQPESPVSESSEVGLPPGSLPGASTEKKEEKAEGEKKEGEKKEEGDKKAEGEKKEEGDKKAEGEKKEGDKKAEAGKGTEKKDEKKTDSSKDGDKKASGDKKDGDKKADSSDKKDGDKTADKDKKEEVKYLPYNPLREAISLMNSQQYNESVQLLTKEIQKSSKNAEAFYMRAVVYVRMRKYDLAAADYKEVLKISPAGAVATLAKTGLSKIHF